MRNKLMLNIAFCGLLSAHMTMAMDLSITSTPEKTSPKPSPLNSPRIDPSKTTFQQIIDCQERANEIIKVMREKKEEDNIPDLISHTNPLSIQSGRLSSSYSKNTDYHIPHFTVTEEYRNTGRFTNTPRSDLVCYKSKYGESYGDLRLGYRFTHYKSTHIDNPDEDDTKEIAFQISQENKEEVINATHIEVEIYNESGKLHEYVIDLNKKKPLEQYDVKIVAVTPSDISDSIIFIMFSYEKDGYEYFIERLLENLPNETRCITHETEDGQKIILNLPENLDDQVFALQQEAIEQQKSDALAKLAAPVEKKPLSYDANLVMLNILSPEEDSVTLHYKKDNTPYLTKILLKNLPTEATSITHITEDGQTIILNLSKDLDQQISEQRQLIMDMGNAFFPKLEEKNPEVKKTVDHIQEEIDEMSTSISPKKTKIDKCMAGLFLSGRAQSYPCYRGVDIIVGHRMDSNSYAYTITYENENGTISTVIINHSKKLPPTAKYLLIKNINGDDEKDAFTIELPRQKEEHTKSTPTEIKPDDAKTFKQYNSYITPVKTVLGIGAFAAIIIAILHQYNKLPQAFINALNRIGILHAQ